MKPLVLVADAHLTRGDPEVDRFLAFLRDVGPGCATLGILGDLFNLWLGRPKFQLSHHREVMRALESLRKAGVRILYVEGNRDFHLRRAPAGRLFDVVVRDSHVETHGSWRIWLTHGDSINEDDRQYRAWKALSKSAPVYGAFGLLPGAVGMKLAERLERTLSRTNLDQKSRFPEEHCRKYAARALEEGCHALVIGHFHEERQIDLGERDGRRLGVWVLPSWRDGHRYLVFDGEEPPRFVSFRG